MGDLPLFRWENLVLQVIDMEQFSNLSPSKLQREVFIEKKVALPRMGGN